jgi:hypothetical protein
MSDPDGGRELAAKLDEKLSAADSGSARPEAPSKSYASTLTGLTV